MSNQISIDDKELEKAIRLKLDAANGAITCTQMREITDLDLVDYPGVRNISAIRHCKNLYILSLQDTQVSDLMPLSGLTDLETLSINCTNVTDLSPLANMLSLRELYIGSTGVTDISPLASMTGLRYVSLAFSKVSDIQALLELRANGGLKKGQVNLWGLPLSRDARLVQVPLLASLDVEVQVS